jgi:MFS family permease
MVTWSIATFSAVWLIQKYWENQNIELYHIGLLWAVCNLSAALTGKIAPKLEEYFGSQKVLAMIGTLPIIAYITMGLFPGLVGVAAALMFYFSRGLNMVIMKEGFNHRIPDKFRNTANSLISLCFRMTFFILGPIIGLVIDNKGMNYTLIALGVLFTFCFIGLMVPLILKLNKK